MRIHPTFLVLILLLLGGLARAGDVTLETKDGVRIAGTFWKGPAKDCPAVVCLPMYGAQRIDYAPWVRFFRHRGMAVLAIDMRGHGDSRMQKGEDWMRRARARDATLFNAMHHDAIAAVRWLTEHGHSPVGLLGASVGCSVALDTARRYPKEIGSVACLTPGSRYLGVDSLTHAAAIPKSLPVLLMSHASEVAAGTSALEKVIPNCEVRILRTPFPKLARGQRGYFHGTRMLGRVPMIGRLTASWFARTLKTMPDEALLDGDPISDAETWSKATPLHDGAHAYRVGRRLVLSGRLPKGVRGLRLEVRARSKDEVDWCRVATGGIGTCAMDHVTLYSAVIAAPQGKGRRISSSWESHLEIAFSMRQGRHGFEAELMLPELDGVAPEVVEVDWGWTKQVPEPPSMRLPWIGVPAIAERDWVAVPSR